MSWEHSGCCRELVSHLLQGKRPQSAPERMRLKDMAEMPRTQGGWVLLDERPGESLLLGLVGKFWRPVIEYAPVESSAFRDFNEPGWAKTIYCLAIEPLDDDHTLLSGTMRTATTSTAARRWFRRYWTLGVGSGAHLLVNGLLEVVRDLAEGPQPTQPRQAVPPWQESRGAAIGHQSGSGAHIRIHPRTSTGIGYRN